ncbi:DUF2922 domain-containing protein [Staphylococcus devriesei]|uniref:DUF2922 domain-containing protein n=1 Tax=Staphylococcus devriesei TaxID=586733 RepID=A0A2K4DRK3_9STAP|nr:DUF2922 domain-containing protein [Staphylococcus devriesei]MCE5090641.1 DUF2922 domain-containing protein [Staphylococcus devriesei]MCE5096769.1 DUF2922 domain-containing protein [Staphylococcus devriesei]PNZ89134.1 DUF2922 domain-containing protein [Staphylococcus devriesei]PTE73462.1 DUF2922 domain-containing protein [Staphylococcus devriesei]PTF05166.1 DUF2922 domain-containing protein [Staphylococcus devriesei]
MSKTLELVFKTNLNKSAKLQFPQIEGAITEAGARAAMDNIIKLNILKPSAGTPVKVDSAQIVDVTTTVIFAEK